MRHGFVTDRLGYGFDFAQPFVVEGSMVATAINHVLLARIRRENQMDETAKILEYATARGWAIVLGGLASWELSKAGARLYADGSGVHSHTGMVLHIGSFSMEVGPEGGEGWADKSLLERVTYYISEADRHLELLCNFVVEHKVKS